MDYPSPCFSYALLPLYDPYTMFKFAAILYNRRMARPEMADPSEEQKAAALLLSAFLTFAYAFLIRTIISQYLIITLIFLDDTRARVWGFLRTLRWSSVIDSFSDLDFQDVFLFSALVTIGVLQYVDGRKLVHGSLIVWGLYQVWILVTLAVRCCVTAVVEVCYHKTRSAFVR